MATNENSRLQELSGSDFEIVDGEPDIRNWDVKDSEGNTVGDVDELIFDVQSRKVRYMVVDLDGNKLNLNSRKVLVPIGLAQLHEKDDDVILPGATAAQLNALPEYKKNSITSDMETSVRNAFAGLGAAGVAAGAGSAFMEDDFYNHGHFDEDNLFSKRSQTTGDTTSIPVIEENLEVGKRTVQKGGVRITSKIVERPVEETLNLKEEQVNVEKRAVDRPATEADFAQVQDKTIELTESAEVPVVNKEARVVEEINVSKDVVERDETIQDTVRKTEVDVDKLDKEDTRNTGYTKDTGNTTDL